MSNGAATSIHLQPHKPSRDSRSKGFLGIKPMHLACNELEAFHERQEDEVCLNQAAATQIR